MVSFNKFSLYIKKLYNKKIIIVALLLIPLSLIFVNFFTSQEHNSTSQEHNSKRLITNELIETNSALLQLERFSVFKKKFFIAYNEKQSLVYAVKRQEGLIHQISLDLSRKYWPFIEFLVQKPIALPEINSRENLFVLDLAFDNDRIYLSFVSDISKDGNCNYTYLYEYNLYNKDWVQLFQSTPCIPRLPFHDIGGKISFNANSIFLSGGNIFTIHPNKVFVKNYKDLMMETNIYGSIVEINKKSLKNKKLSYGHRSPGGLFWDSSRNILWQTEHGPRGGDELNIIENNKDYGWPNVTYGVNYRTNPKKNSEFNTKYNTHEDFKKPLHVWIPSVGVSGVGAISGNGEFSNHWGNDSLIVTSLKDRSLYRLHIKKNKFDLLRTDIYWR